MKKRNKKKYNPTMMNNKNKLYQLEFALKLMRPKLLNKYLNGFILLMMMLNGLCKQDKLNKKLKINSM